MSEQKTPTITIKPSEEIIKKANEVVFVNAGEMRIGLKKPNVLRQYQIVEALGAEAAKNEVFMGMVMPLLWVVSIDDDDQPYIASRRELDSLIMRLGDEGVGAVMGHLNSLAASIETDAQVKN
ncbi:MAG: hypothetical protein K2Y28_10780 [Burkholderiaceae bacterium]|nr:hypothetical protein [Burkholderiaceae bacterium]